MKFFIKYWDEGATEGKFLTKPVSDIPRQFKDLTEACEYLSDVGFIMSRDYTGTQNIALRHLIGKVQKIELIREDAIEGAGI